MTNASVPQFWHISYPTAGPSGSTYILQDSGDSEEDARLRAQTLSRQHGHATVTNREGRVATYVNGDQWTA